jgi:uncharacterized protein (DUF488 family)
MKKIYTIGTSNRSLDDFFGIVHSFGIELLVDVRRFPTSRFKHFTRENLEASSQTQNIGYIWMGELGGYRTGGYEEFTRSEEFRHALLRLEKLARERVTVFLCAERSPWRCHRRFITQYLERRGWEVVHIIERGEIQMSDQLELFEHD